MTPEEQKKFAIDVLKDHAKAIQEIRSSFDSAIKGWRCGQVFYYKEEQVRHQLDIAVSLCSFCVQMFSLKKEDLEETLIQELPETIWQ